MTGIERRKIVLRIVVVILPVLIGSLVALSILPENCNLFGNPDGPFMCDGIPNNCCKMTMAVTYAQIIFGLGAGLSVAAALIFTRNESRSRSDEFPTILE